MQLRIRTQIELDDVFRISILFMMFMAAMNFIDRYYYCVFIAFFIFLFTPKRQVIINPSTGLLLGLAVSILIFGSDTRDSFTTMLKPFTFLIAYTVGAGFFARETNLNKDAKYVKLIIYAVSGGALLHFIFNMIINSNAASVFRDLKDFWTNSVMSATGQACLACMSVGVLSALIFSNVKKLYKIISIVLLAVILVYNFMLAGRTLIYLTAIMLVVALLHQSVVYKKKFLKNLIVIIAVAVVLIILYNFDVFGIKSMFESTNFYARFWGVHDDDIGNNIRLESKFKYIQNMPMHFFGGSGIKEFLGGRYAHDIYLDTYDAYSIFAFFAIVAYMVASIIRLVKCMRSRHLSFDLKQLIMCVYVVINIQLWTEPILQGVPWLFASYCLIDGAVTALLYKERALCY